MTEATTHQIRILNCLLGTAIGDSLGLPFEGLSPIRAAKLFKGPLRHRLYLNRGMVSDDTEHALITYVALRDSDGDVEEFERLLAKGLRGWFLAIPPGIGISTAKACLRLCFGISQKRSGVYSAGNGPLMRAPIIGAFFADDADKAMAFAKASARITHTHPLAEQGAALVALATFGSAQSDPIRFKKLVKDLPLDPIWGDPLQPPKVHPKGVGRFVVDTAKAALSVWQEHPSDLDSAIDQAIRMGGDSDTTAAVVGGIVGAHPQGKVNEQWLKALRDWSGRPARLQRIVIEGGRTISYPAQLLRNGLLLGLALGHGFRRMLPPY
ncbi:MAG: ADP-ribosylglycohydrolase family protein [Fimbriimonadaceae bacterium]|nr:ADP-ribosylglycohydrolase family protein [Fimbriimonadaceae bacterium]